ncbi:MAG: metalloregulator ArsR/SmtB family transcription factor [Chloroflexota bacterium]|nr:metalloregulator ArsR/SmtB family transcription factor [Chloroflexota bacterium]
MGELVAGQPALRIESITSLPLELVSSMSLLHRAVPGSTLDPWLIHAREQLPHDLRENLDLLHGFSGRMLLYPEEPVMRFGPLDPANREAGFDDLMAFMVALPAEDYLEMVANALRRVHLGFDRRWEPPQDAEGWARALKPALTRAPLERVMELVTNPEVLKQRTLDLYQGIWDRVVREARDEALPMLQQAADRGAALEDRGFGDAYSALTGQRLPDVLSQPPSSFTRVAFCPSAHLGAFVSYIAYEPDLVVFFSAPGLLERAGARHANVVSRGQGARSANGHIPPAELLEATRALADPTRLRIVDLLLEGELYAQEIVARLGVAQSAASRHLSQLERAGIVTVAARRGSKYYAVSADRLEALASALTERGSRARSLQD